MKKNGRQKNESQRKIDKRGTDTLRSAERRGTDNLRSIDRRGTDTLRNTDHRGTDTLRNMDRRNADSLRGTDRRNADSLRGTDRRNIDSLHGTDRRNADSLRGADRHNTDSLRRSDRRGNSDEEAVKKGKDKKRKASDRGRVVHVRGSEEAGRANLARRRRSLIKKVVIISLIVIVVLAAAGITYYNSIRQYKGYTVVKSSETVYETNASYIRFGTNLLKYTPEGASYINSNGDIVWTAGTDIKAPIAAANGNYAVVADKGGNKVAVFNTDGQVSENTMPYAICDIDVSEHGAYVVVLESDKTNYINMYSSTGSIIYEIQTSLDKSGYPVDITVSNNGEKLFTSYFLVDGLTTNISLTAYNFGEVGQNLNADRMVGGFKFKDELIPKVEFVTNNTIAAFSDQHIYIYKMKEKPSLKAIVNLDGEVKSIFYSSSFIGTVQKAAEGTGYVMKVYDLTGKLEFTHDIDFEYDSINASDEEIIVTGGQDCLILTKSGRTRFRYVFDSTIKNMIATSGTRQYIVTFENRTETIKLTAKDERKKK